MNKIPKRSDPIYKEIEEFKDYELTNNVAYEMAIRNSTNILLIETLNLRHKLSIATKKYKKEVYEKEPVSIAKYRNNVQKLQELFIEKEDYENYLKQNGIEFSFIEFTNNHINTESEIIFDARAINLHNILDEYAITELYKCISPYYGFLKNKNFEFFNNIVAKRFPLVMATSTGCIHKIEKYIIEKPQKIDLLTFFARPQLTLPMSTYVSVNLNLNLPEKELIDYIKEIKRKFKTQETFYDEDAKETVNIIKTPVEAIGYDLQKTNNPKAQKKPKSHVYADWFYIYDCWKYQEKQNISDKDIFIDIELTNDNFYKEDRIRQIRDKMIYFIDNLGYKELITGVKIL